MIYDIIIIGGGVVGCAIAYELSHYKGSILLLEKEDDVACGSSRSNSGIVHGGFDCVPGTRKAYYNIKGNTMFAELCGRLNVPYEECGSLVVASKENYGGLTELYERGKKNGVEVSILDRNRILELEPNIADGVDFALYSPRSGIVSPYKLTIAYADAAILNGAVI